MYTRAERRRNNFLKARRKQKICQEIYGTEFYKHLHMYSKNKIHCSCPLCAVKTRMKKGKFWYPSFHPKISDKRQIEKLEYGLKDG